VGHISTFVAFDKGQEDLLAECDFYHRSPSKYKRKDKEMWISKCPFVKTHEPCFSGGRGQAKQEMMGQASRAAIILRHPFDCALSEFKRSVCWL